MIHELKTWPGPFNAVVSGSKTFEWRKDDRPFADGDQIKLLEWDPDEERYTGQVVFAYVGYVLRSPSFGVPEGYCVFSLVPERPKT